MARSTKQQQRNQFEIPTLSADPRERAQQLAELIERGKVALAESVVEARRGGATLTELREDTGVWGETLKRLVRGFGLVWPDDEVTPAPKAVAKPAPKSSGRQSKPVAKRVAKPVAKKATKATNGKASGRGRKVA